jgi:probable phosphoglycerate mutase
MNAVWTFLRHGESQANRDCTLAGWRDSRLTHEGRRQARRAGALLAAERFDAIVTSDLSRAYDTARLVATAWSEATGLAAPPLRIERDLRERNVGEWEGRARVWLREQGHMRVLLDWEGVPPGGESQAMLARRAIGALDGHRDGHSLVVCHGGVIRILLGLLDGVPLEGVGRIPVHNAEPIRRTVDPSSWARVVRLAETPML